VLSCDWTGDRDLYRFHRHWRALKFAKKHLRHKQFDLAVLPRRDIDQAHGAFLAYFSGAPLRIGYSDITTLGPKPPYFRNVGRLLTHVLDSQTLKHEVENGLELIHYIGGKVQSDHMEIWLSPEDESFAEQILKSHDIQTNELLIAFALGAAHQKRIWPLSNFITIGSWLEEEYNAHILVVGGQGEEWMANELRNQLKGVVIDTVGQTTLRQATAILKRCHLYVGNDSGLMHLAAAAGISVTEIFCHPKDGLPSHPNSPMRFGPWGAPHRILQPQKAIPSCSDACMAQEAHCICSVTVEQVKEAISYTLYNQGQSKVH
jgi:lipopolysaccharide heptosyltransferase II